MSKKRTNETKIESETGFDLKENKDVSDSDQQVAPEVKDANTSNNVSGDILKRGLAMTPVESPRLGGGSDSAASTRAIAGGGVPNPSGYVGRTPDNRKIRGAGANPMEKVDIRDEFVWNECGSEQYRTLIEGSPAGYLNDPVLGNFTYEDNLVFQFDSQGDRPGELGRPYRRRTMSVSKDMTFFIRGQHDEATANVLYYPQYTYTETDRERQEVDSPAERGNYLIRGIKLSLTRQDGRWDISDVFYDVKDLSIESTQLDLDVREDNAKVVWDQFNKKVTEDYFDMVNNPSNLAALKYSCIPDGQPDAMQHLILSQDMAVLDGTIAYLAVKTAGEAYAYQRYLRTTYGSGLGAERQANYAFSPDIWLTEPNLGIGACYVDKASLTVGGVGVHDAGYLRLTAPEYVMTLLDSPSKYNNNFGVWFTQPRGVTMPYSEMAKAFDECGFIIDAESKKYYDQMVGWKMDDGKLVGFTKCGIVSPVNPNQVYKEYSRTLGSMVSKYTYVDYTLQGSWYTSMGIGSPLLEAIIQAVKHRIVAKLGNARDRFTMYIPFTFDCEHITFMHMLLLEALPYVKQFRSHWEKVFERFEQQYGVNPLHTESVQALNISDVFADSCYKGIGADASFPSLSQGAKLVFADPEASDVSAVTYNEPGLGAGWEYAGVVCFNAFAPSGRSYADDAHMVFPMFYGTTLLPAYAMLKDMGPQKYLCSRDMPIRPYIYDAEVEGMYINDPEHVAVNTMIANSTPFFEPPAYIAFADNDAHDEDRIIIRVRDILQAPRRNGRFAPAPKGMYDFGCALFAGSNILKDQVECYMPLNSNNENDHNVYYGWGASLDDIVMRIFYVDHTLEFESYPIETYRYSFVYNDKDVNVNVLATLLNRYGVHVNGGRLNADDIASLRETFGVNLFAGDYTPADVDMLIVSREGSTSQQAAHLSYPDRSSLMWVYDNVFAFVRNPFSGAIPKKSGTTIADYNPDIGLATLFGLAGYQGLWFNRLNLSIYSHKQEVGGRIYDYSISHDNNIFC